MTEARHAGVAEEVARLLEALQQAAATWHVQASQAAEAPTACEVCPVCQVIAAVQRLRPETVQHLAQAAASLTAALADLVAGPAPPSADAVSPPPERRVDVQRIDITD